MDSVQKTLFSEDAWHWWPCGWEIIIKCPHNCSLLCCMSFWKSSWSVWLRWRSLTSKISFICAEFFMTMSVSLCVCVCVLETKSGAHRNEPIIIRWSQSVHIGESPNVVGGCTWTNGNIYLELLAFTLSFTSTKYSHASELSLLLLLFAGTK